MTSFHHFMNKEIGASLTAALTATLEDAAAPPPALP